MFGRIPRQSADALWAETPKGGWRTPVRTGETSGIFREASAESAQAFGAVVANWFPSLKMVFLPAEVREHNLPCPFGPNRRAVTPR